MGFKLPESPSSSKKITRGRTLATVEVEAPAPPLAGASAPVGVTPSLRAWLESSPEVARYRRRFFDLVLQVHKAEFDSLWNVAASVTVPLKAPAHEWRAQAHPSQWLGQQLEASQHPEPIKLVKLVGLYLDPLGLNCWWMRQATYLLLWQTTRGGPLLGFTNRALPSRLASIPGWNPYEESEWAFDGRLSTYKKEVREWVLTEAGEWHRRAPSNRAWRDPERGKTKLHTDRRLAYLIAYQYGYSGDQIASLFSNATGSTTKFTVSRRVNEVSSFIDMDLRDPNNRKTKPEVSAALAALAERCGAR